MSRTSKLARKTKLSKQTKGSMAGKDGTAKMKCPHQQPKASWMSSKGGKAKGTVAQQIRK
jgi:hypothetical protein